MEMYKDYSEEEILVQTDTMIKDFEKTHKNSLVSAAHPDLGVTTMSAANPYPGETYVGYWWGKSTQLRGNSAIRLTGGSNGITPHGSTPCTSE